MSSEQQRADLSVPIGVISVMEQIRATNRRDRFLITALIVILLGSIALQSIGLVAVNDRANKFAKTAADEAAALNKVSARQTDQAEFENLVRQLLLCGQNPPCQTSVLGQIAAEQARIDARNATAAPGSSQSSTTSTPPQTTSTSGRSSSTTTTTRPGSTTTTQPPPPSTPLGPTVTTVCKTIPGGLC